MLGRTHIALGLMTSLWITSLLGSSLVIDFNHIAMIVAVLGALLPDLDMGTSSLAGKFGLIKKKHLKKIWVAILTLMTLAIIIFLKDTPIFYGLMFIIFMGFILSDKFAQKGYFVVRSFIQAITGIAIMLGSYYYRHYSLIWVGLIMLILLFSKHRGFSHSITFLVASTLMVRQVSLTYGPIDYSSIFFISMASHLLGDMLTKSGISLFLPFSNRRVRLPYTIKTGGRMESIIFIGALFGIFTMLKGI